MASTTATVVRTRGRFRAAAIAFGALLALALLAAPALARSSYDGGPLAADSPTTIANDGTVYALRFTAVDDPATTLAPALLPNTTYYAKVRFTTDWQTGQPASTDNRGFMWNGSSWAYWDAEWTEFPTVKTDASGAVAESQWVYYKFADTTKAGKYGLMVSLSVGGTGNTQNGTAFIPVTVYDPATGGGWVHAGAATGRAGVPARVVGHASPGAPLAVQLTEANLCDDDANGHTDDEQYGPAKAGGFRVAVPSGQAVDVTLDGAIWPAASGGFTIAVPDTDIALGATDHAAPTAPATLTGAPRNGSVVLSWGAASDAAGVTAYRVYRWTDAPLGVGYTADPALLTTVTGARTYTDSTVANGTTYRYLVRAVDEATNVGPRSPTAAATPDGTPPGPATGLVARPGDGRVDLSWTRPSDADFAGVKVLRKAGSAPSGPADGAVIYDGVAASCADTGLVNGTRYYYAVFAYDTAQNLAASGPIAFAVPNIVTTLSVTAAPVVVGWGKAWALSGELRTAAGDPLPGAPVDLEQSTDGGFTWEFVDTLTPAAGTSSYAGAGPIPLAATRYRLIYAGDAQHVSAVSAPVTVTPRVALGTPAAKSRVAPKKAFAVSGSLAPRRPSGYVVKIKCYQLVRRAWKLKKTVSAKVSAAGTASRYVARLSLPSRGSWKLVAYAPATPSFAATTSGARRVTVR